MRRVEEDVVGKDEDEVVRYGAEKMERDEDGGGRNSNKDEGRNGNVWVGMEAERNR